MSGPSEIQWRRLRLGLAVCAVTALAGGSVAGAAWWHERGIAEGLTAAETRLAEARGRYSALSGERQQWRRFGPLFREWKARGRIGEEQPARWTEAMRVAAAGVLAANHRLGAPHVIERESPIAVRATDMSVELEMRHEGDLPVFLRALEREARGLFTVSGCRLARTGETSAKEPSPGAIDASCRLRWQTVVPSEVEPGWSPAAAAEAGDAAGTGLPGARLDLAEPPPRTFGRLFATAAERARLDTALAVRAAAEEADRVPNERPVRSEPPPQPARWVHVDGVVVRSGRSVFAWIDGKRVAYGDRLADRTEPAGAAPPGVRLDAGGRSIVVRPGQHFNPVTGAVADPVRRPPHRLERGRSLQESSRAPLTDPPVPGQN